MNLCLKCNKQPFKLTTPFLYLDMRLTFEVLLILPLHCCTIIIISSILQLKTELLNKKHALALHAPCTREVRASCVPTGPTACSSHDMILIDMSTREGSSPGPRARHGTQWPALPFRCLRAPYKQCPVRKTSPRYQSTAVLLSLSPFVRDTPRRLRHLRRCLCCPLRWRELVYHTEAYCRRPRKAKGEKERDSKTERWAQEKGTNEKQNK